MTCRDCGQSFELGYGDTHKREEFVRAGRVWTPPARCPTCRWERRQLVPTTCEQCGTAFQDQRGHVAYAQRKGIPLLCRGCLAARQR